MNRNVNRNVQCGKLQRVSTMEEKQYLTHRHFLSQPPLSVPLFYLEFACSQISLQIVLTRSTYCPVSVLQVRSVRLAVTHLSSAQEAISVSHRALCEQRFPRPAQPCSCGPAVPWRRCKAQPVCFPGCNVPHLSFC